MVQGLGVWDGVGLRFLELSRQLHGEKLRKFGCKEVITILLLRCCLQQEETILRMLGAIVSHK